MAPRTIIITWTSRGIGRSLAVHYVAGGHKVYGCSRSPATLAHENYTHFICDLTDEPSVLKLFSQIAKRDRGLDILVNNAGVTLSRMTLLTDAKSAERVIRDNFLSTFLATREALKIMTRANRGRIVNISSINVPLGSPGSAIYSASKAAIEHLSHTLAAELLGKDITINTLGLSLVAGEGMTAGLSDAGTQEKMVRLAKPAPLAIEEIAHAIDFFVSDMALNITDQVVYFGGPR